MTPLLNHDQIASVQKVLMRTMVIRKYKKCGMLKNKLNLTSIAGNVAVRSSCMLSMLSRCQNLQRCTFDVNLFVFDVQLVFHLMCRLLEEPLMTMQTFKDVVAMFHFVCQKVPHDNTNLSTLFTLETVGMPVKAERL